MNQLEAVTETNFITENNTKYIQIIWPHNPAENATQINQITNQYPNIGQVIPSEQLRQHNPPNKHTQYYTTK